MVSSFALITNDNPVFCVYIICSMALVLKMLCMAILTGVQRGRKKAYANPEDAKMHNTEISLDDPDVERVRRAHLNDMENIYLFFVVGFAFVLTEPSVAAAKGLYITYALARLLHTLVYAVYPVRQPARAFAFLLANGITVYMTIRTIIYFA